MAVLSVGGAVGEILSATGPTPPLAGGCLIAFASSAVLVWRRDRPATAAVAGFVIAAVYPLVGYPGWAPMVTLFVALFSLAAYGATTRALAGALVLCVAAYLVPLLPPQSWSPLDPAAWAPPIGLVWASLLGATARRRRIASEDRLRRAAEVAEARARQRMADDRLQVARELHDVLAHTISVIAVQSGLAADALDDDVETARRALGTIRASTRQALGELRATLALLRADQSTAGTSGPPRPQPTLAQIPELTERAQAAGLTVRLDLAAGDRALAPAVELTAYRVVQEAITNVIRHAQAHSVDVAIRRGADSLEIAVVDDGRGPQADNPGGFGIRGMRERVEALGGTLVAGGGADRGYELRALLPI
jgi:signal transduction histidine kinase